MWDGRLAEAKQQLEGALAIARARRLRLLEAESLEALAAVVQATGGGGSAAALRCDAEMIFEELRAVEWGRQIRAQLSAPVRRSAQERGGQS